MWRKLVFTCFYFELISAPSPVENMEEDTTNDEVFESLFNSSSLDPTQNSDLFDTPFSNKKKPGTFFVIILSWIFQTCNLHPRV